MAKWTIKQKDMLNYVEAQLQNEAVRVESGAMRYYQGPIDLQSKMPSVKGFIKSRLSGEKVFRPVYGGSGKLVLEPSFENFFALELQNDTYILDRGAYWASDGGANAGAEAGIADRGGDRRRHPCRGQLPARSVAIILLCVDMNAYPWRSGIIK